MARKDWLLVTICAGSVKGLTPVQLQKSLFLLGQEFKKQVGSSFYEFEPYNYGPFDVNVYIDAESLQTEGLVEIRREGRRWPQYYLTSAGQSKAKALLKQVPGKIADYIQRAVSWTQSKTFPELVRAIYQQYPQFRANSVFRG